MYQPLLFPVPQFFFPRFFHTAYTVATCANRNNGSCVNIDPPTFFFLFTCIVERI
ncbi:unnamed protein product [Periconia digitata]|uniref:Uncharacterized protein n=1 Tax=Periconia digitata TaxID=1303443 RepID=A0A9W4XZD3_9PLEO|nr:unnamed protein product [Periconia digitata]